MTKPIDVPPDDETHGCLKGTLVGHDDKAMAAWKAETDQVNAIIDEATDAEFEIVYGSWGEDDPLNYEDVEGDFNQDAAR